MWVDWEMREEILPNWLLERAKQQPGLTALVTDSERVSFGQMYETALEWAGRLADSGVGPGDRVAVLLGNTPEFVYVMQALMQLKAVLMPLNLRLTPGELAWQLSDGGAKVLLYDARRQEQAQAATTDLPDLPRLSVEELKALPVKPLMPPENYAWDDLHTIIYSSGTTGRPKGVRLTYGNHFFNAEASAQNLPAGPNDLWLAVLPLFHVGGLAIILRGLFYAMPVRLEESFDPATVNRALDKEGVTLISVVSNMLARMLDERHDRPYTSSLRYFLVGGGPVPPPLLERCEKAGVPVIQTYGMTETASQAATLAADEARRKLGSAGRPLPGVELRIERDSEVLPTDDVGEIVLRGPGITPGYDHRPEETARAWRGGWFHTGDLGRLDDEGFLYVVDRRDDLIISGGENIYPAEIEAVLLSHPAIAEAGVVGQPSERWGQEVVAFVRLQPGQTLTEPAVKTYTAERLARYKVPAQVVFLDSLPRNATGKLLRRELRLRLT